MELAIVVGFRVVCFQLSDVFPSCARHSIRCRCRYPHSRMKAGNRYHDHGKIQDHSPKNLAHLDVHTFWTLLWLFFYPAIVKKHQCRYNRNTIITYLWLIFFTSLALGRFPGFGVGCAFARFAFRLGGFFMHVLQKRMSSRKSCSKCAWLPPVSYFLCLFQSHLHSYHYFRQADTVISEYLTTTVVI